MSTPGLTAALEAEHAAVYLVAALGGRASAVDDDRLEHDLDAAYDAHVETRDTLVALVGGAEVVPAEPAYALPDGISSAAGIRKAALRVEEACAAALLTAVGEVTGDDRVTLVTALGDAAVRQIGFGGPAVAFPGTR